MKRILIACTAILLSSCTPGVREGIDLPTNLIPEELRDCKFYRIQDKDGNVLRLVRCPNSSTGLNWKSGKSTANSVTVEESDERASRVDEILKKINEDIARLEALKKELK